MLALAKVLALSSCRPVADAGGKMCTYGIRSSIATNGPDGPTSNQAKPEVWGSDCNKLAGVCLGEFLLGGLHSTYQLVVRHLHYSSVSGFPPKKRAISQPGLPPATLLLPLALRHILNFYLDHVRPIQT